MSLLDELRFDDIELIQVPVCVGNEWYLLEEAGGEAAATYLDAKMSDITFSLDEEGKVKNTGLPKGMKMAELVLLSKQIFKADKLADGTYKKASGVPMGAAIYKWPDRVTSKLCGKLLDISELGGFATGINPTQSGESKSTEVG